MEIKGIDTDIYRASNDSLYIIKGNNMKELIQIANYLNKLAASVGINTQFACIPEGVTFEQFRRG